ncbi:hypothetical protein D3C79_1102560 [compost metagenome]
MDLLHIADSRFADGNGAGFVECQRLQLAPQFQIHTTLDQDTVARGRCQSADNSHRR